MTAPTGGRTVARARRRRWLHALRDLADPAAHGQAASIAEYDDRRDVHSNGGIPNRAFYLIASAIGVDALETKAARIHGRALTTSLVPQSDFLDARAALEQAAIDLFGEGAAAAVRSGFDQIGLGPTIRA